ncbi:MAG: DUF47 domain-containing protein [Rhizobiaceae bacterium]|nr:DUF47 domain-containing protein [Rhizobiaceae bacterium]
MMTWFRKLLPREDRFFDLFEQHAATLVGAAEALDKLLAGNDIERHSAEISDFEDRADQITAEVMTAVRRSFITPFDRGDIKDLIESMDDAIDMMRKTVKTVHLFEQKSFEPMMREMGPIMVQCARLISEGLPLLSAVSKNAARLTEIAEAVVKLEEQSDRLHDEGLQMLFKTYGRSDPMSYMIGAEIFGQLEKVVDRFEDVANEISGIVIENV